MINQRPAGLLAEAADSIRRTLTTQPWGIAVHPVTWVGSPSFRRASHLTQGHSAHKQHRLRPQGHTPAVGPGRPSPDRLPTWQCIVLGAAQSQSGSCQSLPLAPLGPLRTPRQASLAEKAAREAPFSLDTVNSHPVPTTLCTYFQPVFYSRNTVRNQCTVRGAI